MWQGLDALILVEINQFYVCVCSSGGGAAGGSELIQPNPHQPRVHFKEDDLLELAASFAVWGHPAFPRFTERTARTLIAGGAFAGFTATV